MKKLILLLILLAVCQAQGSALWAASARRIAVVIGAGDYDLKKNGLAQLSASEDTRRLSGALRNSGWEVTLLNGLQATSTNILRLLGLRKEQGIYSMDAGAGSDFLNGQVMDAADEILFFWGGHGVSNSEGADCIVPLDAVFKNGVCQNDTTLISIDWIKRALVGKGAKTVLMFVDACREDVASRSGGGFTPKFTRSAKMTKQIVVAETESAARTGILMIKSTQPGQYAHEMQSAGAGVFTHFLITLLNEPNEQDLADTDPADGMLNVGELVAYLDFQTQDFVRNLPASQKRGEQVPAVYWENIRNQHLFLTIETKRLSKPDRYFKIKRFRANVRPNQYLVPIEAHPESLEIQYFDVMPDGDVLQIRQALEREFNGVVASWQVDKNLFVTPSIGNEYALFDDYRNGFRSFCYYFPPEIIKAVLKDGKKKFYFSNTAYPLYSNQPRINGYCNYSISEDKFEIQSGGALQQLKVWKIRQTVRGDNSDACSPLVVKADRIYWVLQNEADPLILGMESYGHCYVDNEKIPASQGQLCRRPARSVEYERWLVESVNPKK